MVVLLAAGIGVVVFALWVFAGRDGHADDEEASDTVEHAHLRRMAEAGISSLAPGAIRLAERERTGGARHPAGPAREFWRRFAAASASVERDPAAALDELRVLPGLLEEALRDAERGAVAVEDASRREKER